MASLRPGAALGRLTPEAKGILLTLTAMGMFGCMDGFSKALVQDYPAWLILWIRHLVALAIVASVLAPRGLPRVLQATRRPWLQLLRSSLLTFEMGLVLVVFRTLPLADAHAILAATPLLVTALSAPLLGERVGWRRWLAVTAGFVGILVILRPGFAAIQPAALLAVFCTLMYTLYNLLTRLVGQVDQPDTSYLFQTVAAALLLSVVGPFFWTPIALHHLPYLLALGVLGAAGHYCVVRALSVAPAVVVQPFGYTLLLWAIFIGYVAFGDLPDGWTLLGAAIVVSAGIYAAWREHARGAVVPGGTGRG